jgi:small-conductance mechanosensitive channel
MFLYASSPRCSLAPLLGALVLAAVLPLASAVEVSPDDKATNNQAPQVADQLAQTLEAIDTEREQLKTLKQRLKTTPELERGEIEAQIAELEKALAGAREHFATLAVGGVSLGSSEPEKTLDWQTEMLEIAKPLVSSLKALTEKPRAMDRMRTQIQLREDNLELIDKALANLRQTAAAEPQPQVVAKLDALESEWQTRRQTTVQDLDMLRYQLAQAESENSSILGNMDKTLGEFVRGRGLTLVLAIVAAFFTWWVMRRLTRLVFRTKDPDAARLRKPSYRVGLFGLRAVSVLLAAGMVLFVFYIFGDWFLLGLALIVLIGAAIGLKNTLPRYVNDAKLFLNLGPVREGERVIYGGLPWRVRSLNVYSTLHNPDLYGGSLRLPSSEIAALTSRPCHKDEPWFPTRPGDFVLMDGDVMAKVLLQTPEVVRLSYKGAVREIPTAVFVGMTMHNLSRDGFVAAVVFGIDYAHQAICLDQVSPRFQEAAEARLRADFGDKVVSVKAFFKEAAANSLDYLMIAVMQSSAAGDYFTVQRAIQQACVAVCNTQGWGIPFAQLVVHAGEGMRPADAPSTA